MAEVSDSIQNNVQKFALADNVSLHGILRN